VSLFLAQLFTTPAGFVFLELLDRSEPANTEELDDVVVHIHRLRFVRDAKSAVSANQNESKPSGLDSIPPLASVPRPTAQPIAVRSWRFEHRSTLNRRSRAPGAHGLAADFIS